MQRRFLPAQFLIRSSKPSQATGNFRLEKVSINIKTQSSSPPRPHTSITLHFNLQEAWLCRAVTYRGSIPNDWAITRTAATKFSIKTLSFITALKKLCLAVICLDLVFEWTTNQVVLGISLALSQLKLQGPYLSSTVI